MKKTAVLAALLLMPAALCALVRGTEHENAAMIAPGIRFYEAGKVEVKINGNRAVLHRYTGGCGVKKVLDACLAESEKNGGSTANNMSLWLAACSLYGGTGACAEPDSFGYIFTVNRAGRAVFTVAGSCGSVTEAIRLDMAAYPAAGNGGYDDGLGMFPGAKKDLSIELLSSGRTVNFGNIYSAGGAGVDEIASYYEDEFRHRNMQVLKKTRVREGAYYVLKGELSDLYVSVSLNDGGQAMIFIMG